MQGYERMSHIFKRLSDENPDTTRCIGYGYYDIQNDITFSCEYESVVCSKNGIPYCRIKERDIRTILIVDLLNRHFIEDVLFLSKDIFHDIKNIEATYVIVLEGENFILV